VPAASWNDNFTNRSFIAIFNAMDTDPKEVSKYKLAQALYSLGIFISTAPFIIGLFWNYDGANILWHGPEYRSGDLVVDSLRQGLGRRRNKATIALGHIGSVRTAYSVSGDRESEIQAKFAEGHRQLTLPVWYRSDGKLTIERLSHETSFPEKRVQKKLFGWIALLNGPLILFAILKWRHRRKHKPVERPRESNYIAEE
jgi:hypothetical protein